MARDEGGESPEHDPRSSGEFGEFPKARKGFGGETSPCKRTATTNGVA
jgi:hypothetical protein